MLQTFGTVATDKVSLPSNVKIGVMTQEEKASAAANPELVKEPYNGGFTLLPGDKITITGIDLQKYETTDEAKKVSTTYGYLLGVDVVRNGQDMKGYAIGLSQFLRMAPKSIPEVSYLRPVDVEPLQKFLANAASSKNVLAYEGQKLSDYIETVIKPNHNKSLTIVDKVRYITNPPNSKIAGAVHNIANTLYHITA